MNSLLWLVHLNILWVLLKIIQSPPTVKSTVGQNKLFIEKKTKKKTETALLLSKYSSLTKILTDTILNIFFYSCYNVNSRHRLL